MSFEESAEELTKNVASLGFDLNRLTASKRLLVDYVHIERSEIVAYKGGTNHGQRKDKIAQWFAKSYHGNRGPCQTRAGGNGRRPSSTLLPEHL
jgi:hypothetical protein